jgi:hypothetical protein
MGAFVATFCAVAFKRPVGSERVNNARRRALQATNLAAETDLDTAQELVKICLRLIKKLGSSVTDDLKCAFRPTVIIAVIHERSAFHRPCHLHTENVFTAHHSFFFEK